MERGNEALLVVDDDPFFRNLLLQHLVNEGHRNVRTAQNGLEAIAALKEGEFDLVLLDVQMPDVDGVQVLLEMKRDRSLSRTPVVVVSGDDDFETLVKCIELGAEDYLSKPFNPVLLRARIGAILEKRRLRKLEVRHLAEIQEGQRRADELLNIILPAAAASELKVTGAVAPRRHDAVAIMFCDIVGFTEYCEQHRAEVVVKRLQTLIEAFEEINDRHGMEKIKTIGDSFMAAGGLLRKVARPIVSAVSCGLEMILAIEHVAPGWQVRVGVDVGAIVSGVLGRQKYQFDVWGRVVNVASRMTECATPGTIAMTAEAWGLLGEGFLGRPSGLRNVKGLGLMDVVECCGRLSGESLGR